MTLYGLHIVDFIIVVVYLGAMMWIGKLLAKSIHDQGDFYLAGRKLGKAFQFFLNFGQMTDGNGAASIATIIFKQGVGGVWLAMQTLFMTPYYWFMNKWFRRVRLITVGDLFEDRFGGRSLAAMFAGFNVFFALMFIALGYIVSFRTMEALMVKPETEYTAEEKQMVDNYFEYVELQTQYQNGTLVPSMTSRYETLKNLSEQNEIKSYVSYVKPLSFYAIYGIIVGAYVILGGFGAAVVTDAIQAILIIVFSFILIPFGLVKIGGFSGLHENVPDYMFRLFGSQAVSEYTWYSFLAILFVSMVQIHAMSGNMAIAGSAKNELAARMGAVTGGFGKRFMIICWSLCGLIAVGLLGDKLSNPENAWGALTKELLGPGAIGLMLAGILAANMSSLDAFSVNMSALFVRNLYAPIYPGKSEKHYVIVGRLAIAFFLVAGIFLAMRVHGIVSLLKYMLVMNVTFGAPIYLLFVWRRITKKAVIWQVIITFIVIILLPFVGSFLPAISQNQALAIQTNEKVIMIEARATAADVEEGLAQETGQLIEKTRVIEPVGAFFETVTRIDPENPDSKMKGSGLFYPEIYFLKLIGVNVRDFTPPMLLTARFVFDGAFPFLLLFIFSWMTKQRDKEIVDKFYAKMKTKVLDDPAEDEKELLKNLNDPALVEHHKLLPGSNWEFLKWDKEDTVGFLLSCLAVVVILAIFFIVLNIGS